MALPGRPIMTFVHELKASLKCYEIRSLYRFGRVLLLCSVFILTLGFDAGHYCFALKVNNEPTLSELRSVASVLGRPVERLRLLDQRPLMFAFLRGRYMIYVVRDITTDETLEIALDLNSGRRVDPVELRKRNWEHATVEGHKLEPQLLDLLLGHPELSRIKVRLRFSLESVKRHGELPPMDWLEPNLRERFQARLDAELRQLGINVPLLVRPDFPVLEATLSGIQVVKLGRSPLIQSIELAAEPVILNK